MTVKHPWRAVVSKINNPAITAYIAAIPYAINSFFLQAHPHIDRHFPFGTGRFVRHYASDIFGPIFYAAYIKYRIENSSKMRPHRFSTEVASLITMTALTFWEGFKTLVSGGRRPFDTGNMICYCTSLALWCVVSRGITRYTRDKGYSVESPVEDLKRSDIPSERIVRRDQGRAP